MTTTITSRGKVPPRFNTAWRAVRQSHMDDEAISQVTKALPFVVSDMRAHCMKLREMGMDPLYSWDAEMARAESLTFHQIDPGPS